MASRVFILRHGETEWTISGQATGTTEKELTKAGAEQVSSAGAKLVGTGSLVDPDRLLHVFVSPRVRARQTAELFLGPAFNLVMEKKITVTYTEKMREWDYGDYEGLRNDEIRALRKTRALDFEKEWNIWSDGCEGGESKDQVTERLDWLISQTKDIHSKQSGDILLVGHGLFLRCFWKRWLGLSIDNPIRLRFDPGEIAILDYKNDNLNEPSFHLGVALPS